LHNFFNDLRHLDDSLLSLDNNDWLLNDSVDNHILDFNVILDLFGRNHVYLLDNLLDNLFDFNNFRNSNDFLNNLFDIVWHLNNLFNDLLNMHNLFLNNFYFSVFSVDVVDNLFNSDWFFNLNDFLNESFDVFDFWYLSDHLNDSFNDSWDFNDLLDDLLNLHDLLGNSWDDNWNFNRNWDLFLDLSNLLDLDDLFNSLFNCDDLGNLN